MLSILLTNCTTPPQIEYLSPPQAYTIPCERSAFQGKTYGDAIKHLIKVMAERDLCASQIDKIREWQIENAQH
ncbi:Rz1-like lysis system protein LysC [Histophilus somni]|uniref:Rz1-like lysis system protein LysC n=1 Tax=Histophilus somni TaxID=731 RepID=UPI000045D71A|nr:hypothetical protein [Histophilus somni]QQF66083.1 hypothetical protein JFL60_02060 [Histophilus somni]QQF70826.1 hypothetical protein JFL59_02065 [Histophilus somni]QQF72671.1 hypothetical protein JFL50_02100 [Histophilus somni]QQF79135.1 hypothetical protein JFL53_02080 [Histophilus somni]QQF80914.1 hypothetical protein JFL51_02050 [Histophilus somni]